QEAHNTREEDIFREAMSGVSPITHDKAYHEAEKPKIKPRKETFEEEMLIHDTLSDELEIEDVDNEEVLSFCESGIQKGVFRKLRTGSYRISDELDLHGSTLKQAKQILVYYLQEAVQFEGCCVRIIHGKGHRSGNSKPVLKTHVNHWLTEHERVLAFHSAKARDGGAGAVYVLLKTQP
ncbi:MAG: Smr/MutS family protein, partial [Cocleimonas sp.]